MKNFKLKRLLSLTIMGLLTALHGTTVFAVAEDPIGNRATLTFDVGGSATLLESSFGGNTSTGLGAGSDTVFTEDRLVNFTVSTADLATVTVAPGATAQVQEFTVTNNGNGTQDFLLAAIDLPNTTADPFAGNADTFDSTTSSVFVEDGVNIGYQVLEDTEIFLDEILPAGVQTVYIVSTIPGALANAEVAVLALVAQVADNTGGGGTEGTAIINDTNGNFSPSGLYSNTGTNVVSLGALPPAGDTVGGPAQVVFNDPAGATAADVDSTGLAQDIVQNGQHSDASSFTVSAAILTVQKVSVALWDPINGNSNPKAIPGAYVQYTITVSNAGGAASGDLTTLADVLALTDLDPNLILATATTPVPGVVVGVDIESAVGDSIRIDTSGTARPSAAGSPTYCTGDIGDIDTDGCSYTGGVGGTLNVVFSDPVPANPNIAAMAAEGVYAEGELLGGESVVLVFNAIVQ